MRERGREKNEQETIQLTFLNRAFAFTVGSYIVLLIVVLLSDVLPNRARLNKTPITVMFLRRHLFFLLGL